MEKFLSRSKIVEIKEQPEKLLTGGEWDSLNKQIWVAYTSNQQTEEIYIKKVNLWRYLYIFIRVSFISIFFIFVRQLSLITFCGNRTIFFSIFSGVFFCQPLIIFAFFIVSKTIILCEVRNFLRKFHERV